MISRGKEWLNGKVKSQRNCRCLNKWFRTSAVHTSSGVERSARLHICGGGGFGVYHEKNHGNKETAAGRTIGVIAFKAGTHRDVSRCFPSSDVASLGKVCRRRPCPPACGVKVVEKPFVQGGTHTGRRIRRFFQKPVAGVVVMPLLDI